MATGLLMVCVLPEHSEKEEQEIAMSEFLKRMRLKRWTAKMEACIKTYGMHTRYKTVALDSKVFASHSENVLSCCTDLL